LTLPIVSESSSFTRTSRNGVRTPNEITVMPNVGERNAAQGRVDHVFVREHCSRIRSESTE
jgi:hypothetical protein